RQGGARRGDFRKTHRHGAGRHGRHGRQDRATAVDRARRLPLQDEPVYGRALAALAGRQSARRGRDRREQAGAQGRTVRRLAWSLPIVAAVVAAGVGGYRIGRQGADVPSTTATAAQHASASGPVIYYQDPDGKPFYSAEPKSAPDGRPYRAVYASEDISFD